MCIPTRFASIVITVLVAGGTEAGAQTADDLKRMSLEDMLNLDVSTVSRDDGWRSIQAGGRADWSRESRDVARGSRAVTVQGDIYSAHISQQVPVPIDTFPFSRLDRRRAPLSGGNVLIRWSTTRAGVDSVKLQAYYDHTGFFNDLDRLLSTELRQPFVETMPPPSRVILPVTFGNGIEGQSHGFEVNGTRPTHMQPWTCPVPWNSTGRCDTCRL